MNKVRIVVLGLMLGVLCWGSAALPNGTDAASFIRGGVGARAFGLGGAFVAAADDVSAPFWNPAGLMSLAGINAGGMYTDRFGQGIILQSLGATVALSEWCAGVSMARVSTEGIPYYGEQEGGTFSDTQTVWLGTVGYDLGSALPADQGGSVSSLWVGGSVKYYTHELLAGRGSGIGVDLGLLVRLSFSWGGVSLGLVGQDVGGTTVQWTNTGRNPKDAVPWINRVGVSFTLLGGVLVFDAQGDVAVGHSTMNRVHFGVEVQPIPEISGRAGAVVSADGTWDLCYGASVAWQGLTVAYAYVPDPVLGGTHVLSAQFKFPGL